MVAHQKGEWFQRLMLEMRAGVLDSEFGPQLIDQQLAMQRPARVNARTLTIAAACLRRHSAGLTSAPSTRIENRRAS
jgi:hypothetical protein